MISLARSLVREFGQEDFDKLPKEVVTHCKLLLLDLLGVALGAKHTPEAQGMLQSLLQMGSVNGHGAVLWGTSRRASIGDAALYNGTIAHALELDDFGGADHSGAVVFPAMLSALDHGVAVDGRRFIEATVVGYNIARRMLEASGAYRAHNSEGGWHSTSTCGAAGAAVAVGRLLNLTEDQLVSAIGFATTMTGGTWAFNEDGAMSKRIHPGWAAQLGVKSAFFAKSGLTGPEFCLEAEWGGFFNTYAKDHATPECLLDRSGLEFKILRSGIKPYPCCRDNHSVVDVMLDLHQTHNADLTSITSIEIHCIPEMYKMLANRSPRNTMEAQLSLPHCAAVALLNGSVRLEHFSKDYLTDTDVENVKSRIELIESPTLGFDAEPLCIVQYRDGRIEEKTVPFAKGAPQNPMSEAEVFSKYMDMCEGNFAVDQARQISQTILTLEELSNANDLHDALATKA